MGSSGQTSLVIVLERGRVCQGLDAASRWQAHFSSRPQRRLILRTASYLEPLGTTQTRVKGKQETRAEVARAAALGRKQKTCSPPRVRISNELEQRGMLFSALLLFQGALLK